MVSCPEAHQGWCIYKEADGTALYHKFHQALLLGIFWISGNRLASNTCLALLPFQRGGRIVAGTRQEHRRRERADCAVRPRRAVQVLGGAGATARAQASSSASTNRRPPPESLRGGRFVVRCRSTYGARWRAPQPCLCARCPASMHSRQLPCCGRTPGFKPCPFVRLAALRRLGPGCAWCTPRRELMKATPWRWPT